MSPARQQAPSCLHGPHACMTLQMKPRLLSCPAMRWSQPAIAQHVYAEHHRAACHRQLVAENAIA